MVVRRTVDIRRSPVQQVILEPTRNPSVRAVGKAQLVTLRGLLHEVQGTVIVRIAVTEDIALSLILTVVVVATVLSRMGNRNVRPVHRRAEGPGPLGACGTHRLEILPRGTVHVHGAVEAHAVGQILRTGTVQQRVHRLTRQLHRVKTGGVLVQLLGIAATVVVLGPALTASTNHDPAAAVGLLIAVELLRGTHLRGVQPVCAALGVRLVLLNLPAAGRGSLARGTIIVAGIGGLRTRSNRAQRSNHHRSGSHRGAPSPGPRTGRYARTGGNGVAAGCQGTRTPPTHQRKKIHCLSSETSTGSGRVSHARLSCASVLRAP